MAQAIVTTVAGSGTRGFAGDGGSATSARLEDPGGVTLDSIGNLYIADLSSNRVRKVTPEGVITTVAGDGRMDVGPIGNGGPATSARIWHPGAVVVDSAGSLFIAACAEWWIRKVNPDGIINSFAPDSEELQLGCDYNHFSLDPAWSMAVDASGNLFVPEPHAHRIRKFTPEGVSTVVAGTGSPGFGGDGGPATSAALSYPSSVALDAAGNLYVADGYNHRIRKVSPDGIITHVAGTGTGGFSGDGGPATSAALSYPSSVAVDAAGNLFIADAGNVRIRRIALDGTITTVAGTGVSGFSGDGGPATSAQFAAITGIALDAAGNVFVSDSGNHRIRKVTYHDASPGLSAVGPNLGIPGSTISVTLSGANFFAPVAITAGNDITVSDVSLAGDTTVTGRFSIASNAVLGPRTVKVTTPFGLATATFRVVPPFPDLSVTSQSGRLAVGFDAVFNITVENVGAFDSSGPISLTDRLPGGLTHLSAAGAGWACSATDQTVNCEHDAPLAAGASTSLAVAVKVDASASDVITHRVSVAVAGDEVSSNNSISDPLVVATPTPSVRLSRVVGRQATIDVSVPAPFPEDVTGTVRLTFTPDSVNPADDPAIQFATGGREVAFVIPANTVDAVFGSNVHAAPLGFQTGTVAGTLVFDGVLKAGGVQAPLSSKLTIPRQAPVIESLLLDTTNGLEARITLSSTAREVADVILQFVTQPPVKVSCGSVAGCVTARGALAFDVKSLFNAWYASDKAFGSVSTLRFPFSIDGSVQGSIVVILRNNYGVSNSMSFQLPGPR
jgi:sugar lactone lactonase YvrE